MLKFKRNAAVFNEGDPARHVYKVISGAIRTCRVLVDGRAVNIDPVAAMLNPAAFQQTLHMTIAAYQAVGFAVAGVHAFGLLRERGRRGEEREQ